MADKLLLDIPAGTTIELRDRNHASTPISGPEVGLPLDRKIKAREAMQIRFLSNGSVMLRAKHGNKTWPVCMASVSAGVFTQLKVREKVKKTNPNGSDPRRTKAFRTPDGLLFSRGPLRIGIKAS